MRGGGGWSALACGSGSATCQPSSVLGRGPGGSPWCTAGLCLCVTGVSHVAQGLHYVSLYCSLLWTSGRLPMMRSCGRPRAQGCSTRLCWSATGRAEAAWDVLGCAGVTACWLLGSAQLPSSPVFEPRQSHQRPPRWSLGRPSQPSKPQQLQLPAAVQGGLRGGAQCKPC